MTDTPPLTPDDFDAHTGSRFVVGTAENGDPVHLELAGVTRLGAGPEGHRDPFSLEFLGDGTMLLPQQTYRLEHDTMGGLDVFLVPLGPAEDRMRYEAVFG